MLYEQISKFNESCTSGELDKYFDEAHIAIGTLGCYKKNITHASVLKNREYFSRGIPIIFSEIDDDTLNTFVAALRIHNEDLMRYDDVDTSNPLVKIE